MALEDQIDERDFASAHEAQLDLKRRETLGRLVIEFGLTELVMEESDAVYAIGIRGGRFVCYKGDIEMYRREGKNVVLILHKDVEDPSAIPYARGILEGSDQLCLGSSNDHIDDFEDDEAIPIMDIVDPHWYDCIN